MPPIALGRVSVIVLLSVGGLVPVLAQPGSVSYGRYLVAAEYQLFEAAKKLARYMHHRNLAGLLSRRY